MTADTGPGGRSFAVNVAGLPPADRAAAAAAFADQRVDVVVVWGPRPDDRGFRRGRVLAVASTYGEPGLVAHSAHRCTVETCGAYPGYADELAGMALVLRTDDGQVLVIKLSLLSGITLVGPEVP